jgi:hypothetical protein
MCPEDSSPSEKHCCLTQFVQLFREQGAEERDQVMGEWRKLRNEELHDLDSSPIIIRMIKSWMMRGVGHVARMGEKINVYRLLVGKPQGKRPL